MSLHIQASRGEIAERILLPGDPLRAKYIAENYFENTKCVNELRGALCFTGTYKGVPVSAMGTGMGIPSMMIYATELCRDYGCEKLIRIGTGASFRPDIKILDIIMSQAASTTSAVNDEIFKGRFAPTADFSLLDRAYHKALSMGLDPYVGNTVCYDLLYRDDSEFNIHKWREYGVLGGEMETAGLYTVASHYGKKALSLFTVVVELAADSDVTGTSQNKTVSAEDREKGLNEMITLSLETVIE
ncbi:MAG: purine-nucleoside phosphorylase [Oscillospiraceae bacterium]|nr:purine-nucleoside phosphorylase [Oscillospiraceae bacterium]